MRRHAGSTPSSLTAALFNRRTLLELLVLIVLLLLLQRQRHHYAHLAALQHQHSAAAAAAAASAAASAASSSSAVAAAAAGSSASPALGSVPPQGYPLVSRDYVTPPSMVSPLKQTSDCPDGDGDGGRSSSSSSSSSSTGFVSADGSSSAPLVLKNMNGERSIVNPQARDKLDVKGVEALWLDPEAGPTDIYVVNINSHPPFLFALPALKEKEGVQLSITNDGVLEYPTQEMFRFILEKRCKRLQADGRPPLVLDIGANLGYFSTYVARMGCRLISVEAQPRLLPYWRASMAMNNLTHLSKEHNNIISDQLDKSLKIIYASGCWACSHVEEARAGERSTGNTFIIPPTKIDMWGVDEEVVLMKIDIEGFEVKGLESARTLIESGRVQNFLIEWSPSRWARAGTTIEEGAAWLEKLHDAGYVVRHYELRMEYPQDGLKRETWPIAGRTYAFPRHKLGHLCSWLQHREANIWISKQTQ